MDATLNPYAPGAGTQPPELVGRDEIRERARVSLERQKLGRSSQNILMIGLRGVGKTVLLDRVRLDAEASGIVALAIEAPETRSLPSLIAPQLRTALLKLSNSQKSNVRLYSERGLRALAGFAKALKVKYQDIEVSFDFDPEPGLADNGILENDLMDLLEAVGNAAKADDSALALFIDEMQYLKEDELAALLSALHRMAQRSLPVILVGAGLPQVRGLVGKAKSYAERMFEFQNIDALSPDDAKRAIANPARQEGVEIQADALDNVVARTQGYPYFLQVWGNNMWNVADRSPITWDDVEIASKHAVADLDESFFMIRFGRLTPSEKTYLRAMSELGPGPHRSGNIAGQLGRAVTALAPTRSQLIDKGMIWSPAHGDTAFTAPMFDEFMIRIMPDASA